MIRIDRVLSASQLEQCREIRHRVFVQEQGVPVGREQDGLDADCKHWLAWVDGVASATGRLRKTSDGPKLERIAVLSRYRRSGLGSRVVRTILQEIEGSQLPIVSAQRAATAFWVDLGFAVRGEIFLDAGILHVKMVGRIYGSSD